MAKNQLNQGLASGWGSVLRSDFVRLANLRRKKKLSLTEPLFGGENLWRKSSNV